MTANQPFDEAEARRLLAGSDEDINRALTRIDQRFRRPLSAWVRRRFPGLSADDLEDV